jgi:hypothetical protein
MPPLTYVERHRLRRRTPAGTPADDRDDAGDDGG